MPRSPPSAPPSRMNIAVSAASSSVVFTVFVIGTIPPRVPGPAAAYASAPPLSSRTAARLLAPAHDSPPSERHQPFGVLLRALARPQLRLHALQQLLQHLVHPPLEVPHAL